jgi:hypothetical protein
VFPGRSFRLVYLVANTIMNVTTQEEQDPIAQIAWSHHWTHVGGHLVRHSAPYRYVWPSELDLMARLAGFGLSNRWAGWDKSLFTAASTSQVAVYQKVPSA